MAVLVLGNELTRGGGDGGKQGSHVAFISPPDTGCSRLWTPRTGSTAKQVASRAAVSNGSALSVERTGLVVVNGRGAAVTEPHWREEVAW